MDDNTTTYAQCSAHADAYGHHHDCCLADRHDDPWHRCECDYAWTTDARTSTLGGARVELSEGERR